jgi:hypothetical protein
MSPLGVDNPTTRFAFHHYFDHHWMTQAFIPAVDTSALTIRSLIRIFQHAL